MRTLILSAVIILGTAGFSSAEDLPGAGGQAGDTVGDATAAAAAQFNVKEAFARQKAAGLPFKADAAAIEAALRLAMRSNTENLRFGSRWRQYPDDAVFRNRAYLTGQDLEKIAAGLGPVRTWTCSYDKKAFRIVDGAIGPLIAGANARLYAKPPVPPYTGAERAYRFGPVPPVAEAEPARDESSAGWLDWAAARAAQSAADKMRADRSASELDKSSATVLSPDRAKVREAIRLWRLADALATGGPAPKPVSAAKLNAAADAVVAAVTEKYGSASLKELGLCDFNDYVSGQVGRAAKRLLAKPKAAGKGKPKKK